ncbi:Catechol 2,3-dioxygenase [Rhizobiales bacterium GAS188]|jgi:catechol 2,3-dioxygenase-like lactoylglutathione lyase family enzyme|nr:Catechol 2,3-dioxygenase [Rhizobiales bacterium GAS188]
MEARPSRNGARAAITYMAGAVALMAMSVAASPASADSLPGLRGHDHTGITVPDINQAVSFFTDILGCQKIMAFGPFSDDKGTFMKDALDVHPRAVITQISQIRCGFGSNIELFSYTSPDQQVVQPKNSDVGGYHIAIYVDDIKAADAYLKSKGVHTLFGPIPIGEGPAAGQAILYFKAPWGLQMEAISYPNGMAYEKDAAVKLWTPKDPAK